MEQNEPAQAKPESITYVHRAPTKSKAKKTKPKQQKREKIPLTEGYYQVMRQFDMLPRRDQIAFARISAATVGGNFEWDPKRTQGPKSNKANEKSASSPNSNGTKKEDKAADAKKQTPNVYKNSQEYQSFMAAKKAFDQKKKELGLKKDQAKDSDDGILKARHRSMRDALEAYNALKRRSNSKSSTPDSGASASTS